MSEQNEGGAEVNERLALLDRIEKIIALYNSICGNFAGSVNPNTVCDEILAGKLTNLRFRIGSTWEEFDSKLEFKLAADGRLVATMFENFDPRSCREDNPKYIAALDAAKRFEQAVLDL